MSSLEAKNFVASDSDVLDLAQTVLTASQQSDSGRRNYLKTLIATTQQTLGVSPRLRTTPESKADAETVKAQLAALTLTHERFYAIVTQVAQDAVPAATKDRGIEVNRRTNFARTALSAVRRWVRAGNDLTSLAAKSVTKGALAVEPAKARKPSPVALKGRTARDGKRLAATFKTWGVQDKPAATDALQAFVERLNKQLAAWGVKRQAGLIRKTEEERRPRLN